MSVFSHMCLSPKICLKKKCLFQIFGTHYNALDRQEKTDKAAAAANRSRNATNASRTNATAFARTRTKLKLDPDALDKLRERSAALGSFAERKLEKDFVKDEVERKVPGAVFINGVMLDEAGTHSVGGLSGDLPLV